MLDKKDANLVEDVETSDSAPATPDETVSMKDEVSCSPEFKDGCMDKDGRSDIDDETE